MNREPTTPWHVPGEVLIRFATEPADLDDVSASSVETHITGCAVCRAAVAAEAKAADPLALDQSWRAVVEAVDRPRRGVVERLLARLVPDETARLVAATPALRVSWLAAVAAMIGVVVAVSHSTGSPATFLAVAPLLPLAGVAAAFWPETDPGGEAGMAAPMASTGLLLRRAQAVVATSMLVLGAGALALPDLEPRTAAWLLPALLLTVSALAASTWFDPQRVVAAIASAWILTLLVVSHGGRAAASVGDSTLFAPPGQVAFAVLTALAATVVVARRRRFDYLEVR